MKRTIVLSMAGSLLACSFAYSAANAFPHYGLEGGEGSEGGVQENIEQADNEAFHKDLFAKIRHVNKFEIRAGKLALKQGDSRAVKRFAIISMRDHARDNRQLRRLARQLGFEIGAYNPESAEERQSVQELNAALDDLKELEGKEFDVAYLKLQKTVHEKAIALLDSSLELEEHQAVKTHLEKAKKHIKRHLAKASKLLNRLESDSTN